jgi:L-ascorbate 6-phosphate lactonase
MIEEPIHATWGDWLVSEIEQDDPEGVAIWYLGCNGFVVRSATTVLYIDPYFGDGNPPGLVRMIPVPIDPAAVTECDAVLITHEHIDHMHPPSYGPLLRDDGRLYAPSASYESLDYGGDLRVDEERRTVVGAAETFSVGDFDVHVRGAHDPDAIEPVSFVIEHEAGTFFHGGDSKPASAFAEIGAAFDLDMGALAFGTAGRIYHGDDGETRPTKWYMSEGEVVEAANDLRLSRLLPTHFDMWKGVVADPKSLHEHAASFEYPRAIEILSIGDRAELVQPGVYSPASGR